MKKLTWGLVCFLCLGCYLIGHTQEAQFSVKVQAVTDDNKPVVGAQAEFFWRWSGLRSEGAGYLKADTDANGSATFTGKTSFKEYIHKITKQGYYPSAEITGAFNAQSDGRWQPWEKELKTVLRPVKNPVPMYVKTVQGQLPIPGQWVGYDLRVGDWVSPYGRGRMSDIEFKAKGEGTRYQDFKGEITWRFPGSGNGILVCNPSAVEMESSFPWPYLAPPSGYLREMTWKRSRSKSASGDGKVDLYDEANNQRFLIIRVRGKMYGKIDPVLKLVTGVKGQAFIQFTYYLNPDGTRNLEYNPAKNLFDDVTDTYAP